MSKNGNKRDFSKEILNYLLVNPSGLTITDIAKGINTSRITVSKYVSILEAKKKVSTKEIGAYTLYFNVKRGLIPLDIILPFYIGLLNGLKEDITNKEYYKKYGKRIAEFMKFPYGSEVTDYVLPKKDGKNEKYLKYIGEQLSIFNFIYKNKPKITIEIMENEAIYTINDIDFFDKSEDLDVHFYIASGVIEKVASKFFPKVTCKVKEIDLKNRIVKISLKLNQK